MFGSCNSAYRLRYWNKFCNRCWNSLLRIVATVLTACGIETMSIRNLIKQKAARCNSAYRLRYWNTCNTLNLLLVGSMNVATVLTACGIETKGFWRTFEFFYYLLQQCLPLAVLKHSNDLYTHSVKIKSLQQCLPLAVLKQTTSDFCIVAANKICCNSAYRLRYWN